MLDVILDTLLDSVKLLPFLFLTYLLMEFLEHKAGEKAEALIRSSGRVGPLFGGLLGAFPQCGFSAAASGLYAGRVITLGTLLAIYLSTSDEMLPFMLSSGENIGRIAKIVGIKVLCGIAVGFAVDLVLSLIEKKKPQEHLHIEDLCEEEHCHCEKGILRSALHHTLHIFLFVLLISFALNTAIHFIGEETLSGFIYNKPVLGCLLSALIGLIPNCAASVAITKLFTDGLISGGSMLSGLLCGAGVGVLILFRINHHKPKENFAILGLLYGVSVLLGILFDVTGLGACL